MQTSKPEKQIAQLASEIDRLTNLTGQLRNENTELKKTVLALHSSQHSRNQSLSPVRSKAPAPATYSSGPPGPSPQQMTQNQDLLNKIHLLTAKIKQLSLENHQLQCYDPQQLQEMSQKLALLQSENETIKKGYQERLAANPEMIDEINRLGNVIRELGSENTKLRSDTSPQRIKALESQLALSENQYRSLYGKLGTTKNKFEMLENKVYENESQLRQAMQLLESKVKENEFLQQQIQKLQSENDKQEAIIQQLRRDHQTLQSRPMNTVDPQTLADLKSQVLAYQNEISLLRSQKTSPPPPVISRSKDDERCVLLSLEIERLNRQLAQEKARGMNVPAPVVVQNSEEELRLRNLVSRLESEALTSSNRLEQQRQEIQTLKLALSGLEEEIRRLKRELEAERGKPIPQYDEEELRRLQSLLRSKDLELNTLKSELDHLRASSRATPDFSVEKRELEDKINSLYSQISSLQMENDRLRQSPDAIRRLEAQIADKDREIANLKQKANEVVIVKEMMPDPQVAKLQTTIDFLTQRVKQLEEELSDSKQKLAVSQTSDFQLKMANERADSLTTMNDELRKQIQKLQQDYAELQLKTQGSPTLEDLNQLRRLLGERDVDINKLKEALNAAEGDRSLIQLLREEKQRFEEQLTNQDKIIHELKEKINELQMKINGGPTIDQLQLLQSALLQKDMNISELQKEKAELLTKLAALKNLEDQLNMSRMSYDDLKKQFDAQGADMMSLKEKLSRLISPDELKALQDLMASKDEELERIKTLFSQLGDEKLLLLNLNKQMKDLIGQQSNQMSQGKPSTAQFSDTGPSHETSLNLGNLALLENERAEKSELQRKLHEIQQDYQSLMMRQQPNPNLEGRLIDLQDLIIKLQTENEGLKYSLLQQNSRTDNQIAELNNLVQTRNQELHSLLQTIGQLENNAIMSDKLVKDYETLSQTMTQYQKLIDDLNMERRSKGQEILSIPQNIGSKEFSSNGEHFTLDNGRMPTHPVSMHQETSKYY